MLVNRTFWTRIKGSIEQSFSYAKESQADKFAHKWGGQVVYEVNTPDDADEMIAGREVWSVLHNFSVKEEESKKPSSGNYSVLIRNKDGSWSDIGESFDGISPANTKAKELINSYKDVLVVKND